MKKLLLMFLFFMLFAVCGIYAQTRSISGKVTDESGEAIPGVNIFEKGTTNGTTSDSNGGYVLSVSEGATLVFSFIGYASVERAVGTNTILDIPMKTDIAELSEVVVVGYGVQRKTDLTGAVASASGEKLQERPTSSLPQALSGKITGASVSQQSGKPGGKTQIRIRGNTSVSLDNSPLYVVDGVILVSTTLNGNSSPIDYINPNDIESVEVLKDASATAIYGSRGANGVIMVTTKRGGKNGGRVNYDSYYGVGKLVRKMDVLNSEEFMRVEDIAYTNAEKYDEVGWLSGKYVDPKLKRTDPRLFNPDGTAIYDTDWQDEITTNPISQNHQLSFTNGGENGSFGAYLGYTNEEGLMKISWLKRYSSRLVFDTSIKKWLKVGGSLSYNNQKERLTNPAWVGRQLGEAIPMIPVKYPDGSWASNLDYPGMEGGPNPIQVGEQHEQYLGTQTVLGNMFVNLTLAEGLELRSTLGINSISQNYEQYAGRTLNFIGTGTNGYAQKNSNDFFSWQFENYLTYNKKFAEIHSINAMAGLSWQQTQRSTYNVRVNNFSDDFFSFNNLGAGSVLVAPTSSLTIEGINSYFGRINYGLKDKYLLTMTGRIDGSSKFGANNRYAFFPSAALAWRISEEGFLSESSTISNLKLRASYGETGNSGIPAYGALGGLSSGYSYVFNGAVVKGIGTGSLANPELKWERTKQIDAGVEIGLFNGRVGLEADVYLKQTDDMLLNAPVPTSSGYTSVFRNIGSMENKGVELTLNTVNIEKGNFTWETMFNISINKNEVTALSGGSDLFSGPTIIRVGEPVGSFWGFILDGTWGSDEADAAKAMNANWVPGDIKLRDLNGDGTITAADNTIIGRAQPAGFGSFINTINYKNFEFSLDLQYTYGNDVFYALLRTQENRQGIANSQRTVLNAWTPDNQNTEIAQLRPIAAGYDQRNSTHLIQDGSYIRGRNMLLAYNFSSGILDKLSLQRLRVYTSLQNFFILTEYAGYDPEAQTSNSAFAQGENNYQQYPRPMVFMVGLNVSF